MINYPWLPALLLALTISGCGRGTNKSQIAAPVDTPNILLIVVDDMGFTDLGSFGSEIATPTLDSLANNGIRFTNFQVAPTCSPTRAMLLTGTDNHTAGLGNMDEELSPNQKGQPGYEGYLNNRVVTVASLLRDSGYQTYMLGKWHLGKTEDQSPAARGFVRSFAMLSGGASHFGDMKPAYAPSPTSKAPYRQNGKKLEQLPANFHYSSQFYVDELIHYLEADKDTNKPFFAYLAYTAPHVPLQAPNEAIAKYKGKYDGGYDKLLAQRFNKQKELGLLSETAQVSERPPKTSPWEDLSAEEQKIQTRQMEIYAAMIDEIDVHTGRLVDYLKSHGLFDNTLIVFMSDNGAEGHDLDETWPGDKFPAIRKVIDETHDFSYENMGKERSYVFQGEGWAWASQPALRLFKGFTSEGGTRVAAFAHFPKQFPSKQINHELISIKDIAPTILELAGTKHPGTSYQGRPVAPILGVSMLSSWRGGMLTQEMKDRVIGMELMGKRSIRKGDWKLIHMPSPYGSDDWQLYNLATDLREANDLAASHPDTLQEMINYWDEYASAHQVIIPDWLSGY